MSESRILVMSEGEKGFLAGLFEGDGYISLQRDTYYASASGYPYYICYLGMTNCCKALLEHCQRITGVGTIHLHSKSTTTHRASCVWRVNKKEYVLKMLDAMYPFLVGKKRQAEIAYTMVSTFGKNKKVSTELAVRRSGLYDEFKTIIHGRIGTKKTEE